MNPVGRQTAGVPLSPPPRRPLGSRVNIVMDVYDRHKSLFTLFIYFLLDTSDQKQRL